MSELVRFGVSLEKNLLNRFDALIMERSYTNRSEALRDMIRQELVRMAWEKGQDVAGAIILNYDHHQRDMLSKITDIQHGHQEIIISTQHIHLDHHTCLEIVAVRGKADEVEHLADALKSVKGVRHSALSMSGTGRDMG
jgi:CopG family nickel-responsive transcriptional regulator